MCAIFGVSYQPGRQRAQQWTPTELAQLMFRCVAQAGPDAFGLMWCTADGEIRSAKWAGPPDDLDLLAEVDLPDDIAWFIGHARDSRPAAGGHGPPSEPLNNHPVRHHHIAGVHVGTITNYRRILKVTGRMDDRAEVDSEAIFAAVARYGPRRGLASVNGILAIAFVDLRDPSTIRLARSWGAPIGTAWTAGGALAFSSQRATLSAVGADAATQVTGQYQLLSVCQGGITGREQYRPVRWTSPDGANRIRAIATWPMHTVVRRMRRSPVDHGRPLFDPPSLLADLARRRTASSLSGPPIPGGSR